MGDNLPTLKGAAVPNIVEIRTKEGKTYSTRVDYVLGHPKNPMSFEDCVEKFRKSINFGTKLPPRENIEEVIKLVRDLENAKDVIPCLFR